MDAAASITTTTTTTARGCGGTKRKILGQDPNIVMALIANIVSWFVTKFLPPMYLSYLVPKIEQEEKIHKTSVKTIYKEEDNTQCIVIGQPGGVEQLRCIVLKNGFATSGYNVVDTSSDPITTTATTITDRSTPFRRIQPPESIPYDCVVVRVYAFSINYADCCIRWGLYESANEYVGYPIVPGFDIAGVIEQVSSSQQQQEEEEEEEKQFKVGDQVFGCTLFGAYSTRVVVPTIQLRKIPLSVTGELSSSVSPSTTIQQQRLLSMTQAASLPAVALTSLYALFLAGLYHPNNWIKKNGDQNQPQPLFNNRSILIHSAAGGVGSMLVQMSKILHLSPIVGIVGHSSKVDAAKMLGCHVVIDKSQYQTKKELWNAIRNAANYNADNISSKNNNNKNNNMMNGGLYGTVMDSNGIETIQYSYDSLAPAGRLIVFGFHTNLPIGSSALSPLHWIRMIVNVLNMPTYQPMDMVSSNRSILAFNLSFFDKERELLALLFQQIMIWYENNEIQCPRIVTMSMKDVITAHDTIQSGKTIGKLVLTTPYYDSTTTK